MDGFLKNIKRAVSQKKRRYQDSNGFDLDLTFITERVIAMGFPADKVEGLYRNHISEVQRFFETYYAGHYKIYNLCSERSYDPAKFEGRVAHFPFDDHNAPPFRMMEPFCRSIDMWLRSDEKNVAAVHCKAGKGRTGVMICALMLYTGFWHTADEALNFFAASRTSDQAGVTIPSQRRYVTYFDSHLKSRRELNRPLVLTKIRLHTLPLSDAASEIHFQVVLDGTMYFASKGLVKPTVISEEPPPGVKKKDNKSVMEWKLDLPLTYDVKMTFYQDSGMRKDKLFYFWYHTAFIESNYLCLQKKDLDKALKDKKHKQFDQRFYIELFFREMDKPEMRQLVEKERPKSLAVTKGKGAPEATDELLEVLKDMGRRNTTRLSVAGSYASVASLDSTLADSMDVDQGADMGGVTEEDIEEDDPPMDGEGGCVGCFSPGAGGSGSSLKPPTPTKQ